MTIPVSVATSSELVGTKKQMVIKTILVLFLIALLPCASQAQARSVKDATGRQVVVPDSVDTVICSGSGCLRLLCYLQAQNKVVAVDTNEGKRKGRQARPYHLANPQFQKMPIFGEFRGFDNPEQILSLEPQPQVILKVWDGLGHDPVELQEKTGIPVVALSYGDLGPNREQFYQTLRIMGQVVGKPKRAEEVVTFFTNSIEELRHLVQDVAETDRPTVFIGGVAKRGPHGLQSTEPGYPPFDFIKAKNVAYHPGLKGKQLSHADIAKEKIVELDPRYLFLDLTTLHMGENAGGLNELRTDPAYRILSAVQNDQVYGVLPYNWYNANFGSILANAWFIGKTVYPEHFQDVDPTVKADEIYTFLVGRPVFKQMDALFSNQVFRKVPVNE
ncbi:MAG: iron ABC transporter substrate-binding protein [Pseudodesulfovibrio sp.]|uniref:iron ABC transporter substrate-binding protein n=1 Tax=Pseudodesulfovibrio sp. TaxID=2035812 RepID=UPI003D0D188E